MLEDSTAELLLHLGSTARKERRGASAKHSISFLLDEQEITQHGAEQLLSQEKRKHNNLESEDEQRNRQPKRTRRQQTNDGAPLVSPPASSSAPQPRPILPSFSSAAVAPLGAHLNWPFQPNAAAVSTGPLTAGSPFFPFATLHAGQPAIFLLPSLYVPSQPLLPAVQPQQQSAQSTRRDQNTGSRREEAFFAPLAPGSPGLSSTVSSPPSSPVPLLSSSPSSPGFTTTTTTTPSNPSLLSPPEKSARNAEADVDAKTPEVDVQQHTQQLLKQWHRQRQVQKLLYIKQKTHKKNAIEDSSRPATPAVASHASPVAPIAPVTTFTSAAAGQPSSMPAEALMALVEDLLQRHVGSWVPPPKPAPGEAVKHEKEHGKRRHRVPTEHLHVLEEVFAAEPFPHAAAKNVLAQRLGMTKRSVTIWFQNKRARLKRNDGELSSPSSSATSSTSASSSARSGGKPEGGIVFHQLTVDTAGQLAIIPEFPLDM